MTRIEWVGAVGVTLGAAVLALPLMSGTAMANPAPTGDATVVIAIQGTDNPSIPADGSASVYYHGSWQAIDAVDPNNHAMVEADLEPGTYSFAVTLNGTRQQKVQTVSSGSNGVYFHAALVDVALSSHNGSPLTADSASYYAGGWKPIAASGVEMLPGSYSFAATYNGTRQQKLATVTEPNPNNQTGFSQTVSFQTTLVNVQASDHSITTGYNIVLADASYYAGGWHAMTIVNVNNRDMRQAEMLPGTYSFADSYNGTRQQKNGVVVGTGPIQSVYFVF